MKPKEIFQKIALQQDIKGLLNDLKINSTGIEYYSQFDLNSIEVKCNLAKLLAQTQVFAELIDVKFPGFKNMNTGFYDAIIEDYELELKISKDIK